MGMQQPRPTDAVFQSRLGAKGRQAQARESWDTVVVQPHVDVASLQIHREASFQQAHALFATTALLLFCNCPIALCVRVRVCVCGCVFPKSHDNAKM